MELRREESAAMELEESAGGAEEIALCGRALASIV